MWRNMFSKVPCRYFSVPPGDAVSRQTPLLHLFLFDHSTDFYWHLLRFVSWQTLGHGNTWLLVEGTRGGLRGFPVYTHSLSRAVVSVSPPRPRLPLLAPALTQAPAWGWRCEFSVWAQLPGQLAVTLLCRDGDKLLSLMNLKHKSTQFLLFTRWFWLFLSQSMNSGYQVMLHSQEPSHHRNLLSMECPLCASRKSRR